MRSEATTRKGRRINPGIGLLNGIKEERPPDGNSGRKEPRRILVVNISRGEHRRRGGSPSGGAQSWGKISAHSQGESNKTESAYSGA